MEAGNNRIPELDALRGISILGMIIVHFFYDLAIFGGVTMTLPGWFQAVADYGHLLFILLSGICATLGNHSCRRGIQLWICSLLISYVTLFCDLILGTENLRIWFGILHFLGTAMILWPLFERFSGLSLTVMGLSYVLIGWVLSQMQTEIPWMFPLGLCSPTVFPGSDYFPLFPNLGWFLLGAAMGKTLYQSGTSLLPRLPWKRFPLAFFRACGRTALPIYLIHQPVLILLILILT